MRLSLLSILVCPRCVKELALTVLKQDGEDILDGVLQCARCSVRYLVVNGIPRMVGPEIYWNPEFEQHYRLSASSAADIETDVDIRDIQSATDRNFGHEWIHYARFGWDDPEFNAERSRRSFYGRTLLERSQVAGRLVLDAGCGNGRFSRVAAEDGARMVAVDIGRNVESTDANLRAVGAGVSVVQDDIFHLPFRPGTFDVVYTIGVIQHTGNGRKAFGSLVAVTRPDGLIAVRTYRRGNPTLEDNDARIRKETVRLDIEDLHELSRILHSLTGFLKKKGLLEKVQRHVNLFEDEHSIFDWYAAPVAEKFEYDDLYEWCAKDGVEVLKDINDCTSAAQRSFGAISLLGRKRLAGCEKQASHGGEAGGVFGLRWWRRMWEA